MECAPASHLSLLHFLAHRALNIIGISGDEAKAQGCGVVAEVRTGRHEPEGSTTPLYCLERESGLRRGRNSALVRTRENTTGTVNASHC